MLGYRFFKCNSIIRNRIFKGVIGCEKHFYMLFEHKSVLAVYVHNHPVMIKIHPVFLCFLSTKIITTFSNQAVLHFFVCVTSHRPRPSCPEWAVISLPLFPRRSRYRQEWLLSDWCVLLLDVIMNIAVFIYSRHLNRWRHSGLHLFLKGICPRCA